MNPANMNFKDTEIFIMVDGQEIPIEGVSNVELDSETFEFKEQPFSIPYQGTLTVSDFKLTLSLRHLDKFKVIRMNGEKI